MIPNESFVIKILPLSNLTTTNLLVTIVNHQQVPIKSYMEILEILDFLKNDRSRESAFSVIKREICENKNL